ncbi:MAG: permease-like cell division protein FtsX [Gammaproteobacteria bacterium]|nr:permease-like cell division protein FtsX [Gammaproteobacteria bacterium]
MAKVAGRPHSPTPGAPVRWLQDHVRALTETTRRLRVRPAATLLTLLVIGTTLALPASLQALLGNLGAAGRSLGQRSLQITLFIRDSVDQAAGRALAVQLARRPGVATARYVSKDQALAEFKARSQAADALALIDDNPLPASITLELDPGQPRSHAQTLEQQLAGLPEIERAHIDAAWIDRLYALANLLQRAVWLLAAALAVTVLIVVGNTIRLDIENRREETVVLKLLGAPNGYVRRPFLYMGLCYGAGGALLAWALVAAGMAVLARPVSELAGLYHSDFALQGLSLRDAGLFFACALALGWCGAFVTVSQHLRHIEPS